MEFNITKSYTLITEQTLDGVDFYIINPFDQNGFLIQQFNIDVRLDVWNGQPIIINMPSIASLKGDYNFVVNVTSTFITDGSITPSPFPVVLGGNDFDNWNDGYLYQYESMTWTPIGMYDSESGAYSVTPYNQPPLIPFSALRTVEDSAPETTPLTNVESFKNWVALSKNK